MLNKNTCCCPVCGIACLLVTVGALNWGLVGAFNFNLVSTLLGSGTTPERIVYILVGVAAIVKVLGCFIKCPMGKGSCGTK